MKVIAIDDERLSLESIVDVLSQIDVITEVQGFSYPEDAIAFIIDNEVDIVFCDIVMYEENGIEIAKKIKRINPNIYIVFTTAYSEYALDAMKMHANGYLLKPISLEEMTNEIMHAVDQGIISRNRIKIQTFGNFEVFNNQNLPIYFKRSKAKELLAYLVDRRGASVNMAEICAVLWEERPDDESLRSLLRHVVSCLMTTLNENDFPNVVIKQRNSMALILEKVDCDLYQYLNGNKVKIKYLGEYMSNYSWTEYTRGILGINIF